MKRKSHVLIISLFVLISSCDQEQDRVLTKTYHENGKIESIGFLADSVKVGTWYEFDNYGKLTLEFPYIYGKVSGIAYEYRNGAIRGIHTFKNGKMVGKSRRFYPNGNLFDIDHYENGEVKGFYLQLDSAGILSEIEYYDNE